MFFIKGAKGPLNPNNNPTIKNSNRFRKTISFHPHGSFHARKGPSKLSDLILQQAFLTVNSEHAPDPFRCFLGNRVLALIVAASLWSHHSHISELAQEYELVFSRKNDGFRDGSPLFQIAKTLRLKGVNRSHEAVCSDQLVHRLTSLIGVLFIETDYSYTLLQEWLLPHLKTVSFAKTPVQIPINAVIPEKVVIGSQSHDEALLYAAREGHPYQVSHLLNTYQFEPQLIVSAIFEAGIRAHNHTVQAILEQRHNHIPLSDLRCVYHRFRENVARYIEKWLSRCTFYNEIFNKTPEPTVSVYTPEHNPFARKTEPFNRKLDDVSFFVSDSKAYRLKLDVFESNLSYRFRNQKLLKQALTRPSALHVGLTDSAHYETLEFVGDRVLNLVVATQLWEKEQGNWSRFVGSEYEQLVRNTDASQVHGSALFQMACQLELDRYILKSEEEVLSGGSGKKSEEWKMADHMEAIIGALFIDSQYKLDVVTEIIIRLWQAIDTSKRPDYFDILGIESSPLKFEHVAGTTPATTTLSKPLEKSPNSRSPLVIAPEDDFPPLQQTSSDARSSETFGSSTKLTYREAMIRPPSANTVTKAIIRENANKRSHKEVQHRFTLADFMVDKSKN